MNWIDISKNEIHGTFAGHNEPVFVLKRESESPYFWVMTGLYEDRSQYRNDLKSQADYYVSNILK